jgi:hypothetical protein
MKRFLLPLLAAGFLAACSPPYNWRDYSSQDAPFRVMFPDKPSVHKRTIDVGGMPVEMTMTAVSVNGVTYAVGSAQAPDADKAAAALAAMKTALVRNIGATVNKEKSAAAAAANEAGKSQSAAIDIEASGAQNGTPMKLIGHFESRDKRFYQVIVIGRENAIPREQADQFISSFKLL